MQLTDAQCINGRDSYESHEEVKPEECKDKFGCRPASVSREPVLGLQTNLAEESEDEGDLAEAMPAAKPRQAPPGSGPRSAQASPSPQSGVPPPIPQLLGAGAAQLLPELPPLSPLAGLPELPSAGGQPQSFAGQGGPQTQSQGLGGPGGPQAQSQGWGTQGGTQAQPQGFAGQSGTQPRPPQPQQQQPGGMYGQQASMYQQQQTGQAKAQAMAQAASAAMAAMAAAPASAAAAAAAARGTGTAQMPASMPEQPRPPLPAQQQQVPGVQQQVPGMQQQGYHGQQAYRVRPLPSIIVLATLHARCMSKALMAVCSWLAALPV